jgi:hypothetical protein
MLQLARLESCLVIVVSDIDSINMLCTCDSAVDTCIDPVLRIFTSFMHVCMHLAQIASPLSHSMQPSAQRFWLLAWTFVVLRGRAVLSTIDVASCQTLHPIVDKSDIYKGASCMLIKS